MSGLFYAGALLAHLVFILYSVPAVAEHREQCAIVPESANPFGLVREAEFKQRFEQDIQPYWENNGTQGRFCADDGICISYMTFLRDDEKGAIVISSGRTESYVKYKEVVYELGQQGYSVYIHDHRGQGFSDRILAGEENKYKGHVDEFDDYVNDLDTFVREVVLSQPHEKLFLLAHSMGGGIATRYIETHPDVFDAAALSSPMHAPDARILVSPEGGCLWFRLMDWICKDCYAGFTDKPYNPEPFEANEYTHSEVRYAQLLKTYANPENVEHVPLGGPTRGWAGQACAASAKMLKDTGEIKIPVLVLQAGADTAVTPEGQDKFCSNLEKETGWPCFGGGPITYEGAKHELFIECDEYRIPAITAILDFFSKVE